MMHPIAEMAYEDAQDRDDLVEKVMETTGIDRAGAEAAIVDGKRIASAIRKSSVGRGLANIRENGIDAELADLEADIAPPKKRKAKATSPTARTLAELRKRGWPAGVVEKFVRFPPPGHHVDLFGVLDLVAIVTDPCTTEPRKGFGTIGIQACAGGDVARRRGKILAEPRARQWVEAGNRLELWSWSKRVVYKKNGSKAARPAWTLRVETYAEMIAGAT